MRTELSEDATILQKAKIHRFCGNYFPANVSNSCSFLYEYILVFCVVLSRVYLHHIVFCGLTIFAKWPNEIPNNSKHDMITEMFIKIISKKMHNERKSDLKLVIRCTNVDCGHLLLVSCLNNYDVRWRRAIKLFRNKNYL